jgi:hypothetical protein
VYNTGSAAPVTVNAIFCAYWSNRIFTEPAATCTVTYSCVSGGHTGAGNIDADPLFVDLSNGDVRLLAGSPCIDTGTASGAPADDISGVTRPRGAGFDMGAHEFVNAAPVIDQGDGPLTVTMSEDGEPTPWHAPLLSATDPDTTDTLTWPVLSPAANGTATVSGTGESPAEFVYAPEANWHGADTFTVQVRDGLESDTIEIEVTVESVPDLDDPDEDGLTTEEERALGTDPYDPDSDGGGWSDGEEVAAGTNPLLDTAMPVTVSISGTSPIEVTAGDSHTFQTAITGGTGEIHYQWYFEADGKGFTILTGEEGSTLGLTDISLDDAGYYQCHVWGDITSAESDPVQLRVASGVPVTGAAALAGLSIVLLAGSLLIQHRRN